jgi:hypothetical protein
MEKRRTNVTFLPELYLLTVNRGLTVGMAVARSVANGTGVRPSRLWEVRKLRYRKSDLTLIVRLDSSNTKIKDYFLMPTASLPMNRDPRIRISTRFFGEFGYEDFDSVLKAFTDRLNLGRIARRPN